MAPEVMRPPGIGNDQISLKTIGILFPKQCIFLFLVWWHINWYVGHKPRGWSWFPWNRKWSEILKTVEIPTRKLNTYIFLFPSSRDTKYNMYVGHEPRGGPDPPRSGSTLKRLRSPPLNNIQYIILFLALWCIEWYLWFDP